MEEKIITNMADLSAAAEEKFKDIVNNNVTDNPEGPNKINEPKTELPATGSIPDKSVTVDNPFKTDAGVLGDDAKLVNPEVKIPTPDTEQEKAVSGVTDETAAIKFDENVANAKDGSDEFEEAMKKTEEELNKALEGSEGGATTFTANGSDSSMDGSSEEKSDEVPTEEEREVEEEHKDETDYGEEDKKDDSKDEEFEEGKECDETEFKNITPAPPTDTIIDKVDKFTTVDGEKLKEAIPPVVEGTLNSETKEVPTENPTSDIVNKENAQTGTIGEADGASEIIEVQKELNILGDSISEDSTGDEIGSDANKDITEEKKELIGEGTEIGSESEDGDDLPPKEEGDEEAKDEIPTEEENKENKDSDIPGDDIPPSEGSGDILETKGDLNAPPVIVENADKEGSSPIETDVDLAGTEFEKTVKEFENIVKVEETENVGEAYIKESNIITGGLDEMAAHAESVRASMKEMTHVGFEGAMINANANLAGMEAATNVKDTFDPNGQLFEDIFKNFPK